MSAHIMVNTMSFIPHIMHVWQKLLLSFGGEYTNLKKLEANKLSHNYFDQALQDRTF